MKKKFVKLVSAIAVVLGASLFCSCESSSSKTSKPEVCPICKRSLEGKNTVMATMATGDQILVCVDCYGVGVQFGKCF